MDPRPVGSLQSREGSIMISRELIRIILEQYKLPLNGTHGLAHWARVFENGQRLAGTNAAKLEVVELFALFHDSKRVNEAISPQHGRRAADFAASLRDTQLILSDEDFDLLYTACVHHTDGGLEGDITVQTCWDADRLDLGRVWIKPVFDRLCTMAAKDPDVIEWAYRRSREQKALLPDWVQRRWHLDFGGSS